MDETLVRLMSAYTEAWKRGDVAAAMAFWAEDVVLRASGQNPLSGLYRGKIAVRRQLVDRMLELTNGQFEVLEVVDQAIGTEHVFAIVHERFHRPDGRRFETRRVLVYRWVNGLIVEVSFFDPDQASADQFWASGP